MKFKDTYSLLQYLYKTSKIDINVKEYRGFPEVEILADFEEALKKHLKGRFSDLIFNSVTMGEFKLDGIGTLKEFENDELILSFKITNEAFPSSEFMDSEENEKFILNLMSCLYENLSANSLLKNPPIDEDFEYEQEFNPIPIDINFVIVDGKIIEENVEVLNKKEIVEFDSFDKTTIISNLYTYIKDNNDGVCDFSYSEGSNMRVRFNAKNQSLDIEDFDMTEIFIMEYFTDDVEYEVI